MTRTALRKQEPRAAASAAAPHYRLSDYPMHYFAAIQRQNQLNLTRVLRACALTVPTWRVLSTLVQKDGQTVGQIATMAVLDRSALGRLLEQMEAEGLVARANPPEDRRAVVIRITPAGRKRFGAALPLVERHYRGLLHGLTPADFKALMRLLRRIKANALMMADPSDLDSE